MSENRQRVSEEDILSPVWDAESSDRCIVCNRPSGGKAICSDARCAEELARG